MEEIEKAKDEDGLRLYNEYGSALTRDAVAAELGKYGLEVIDQRDLDRKVSEEVDSIIYDRATARWDSDKRRAVRKTWYAFFGLMALLGVQMILLTLGIMVGDWRFAQVAAVLTIADATVGVVCGVLSEGIPEAKTRPRLGHY